MVIRLKTNPKIKITGIVTITIGGRISKTKTISKLERTTRDSKTIKVIRIIKTNRISTRGGKANSNRKMVKSIRLWFKRSSRMMRTRYKLNLLMIMGFYTKSLKAYRSSNLNQNRRKRSQINKCSACLSAVKALKSRRDNLGKEIEITNKLKNLIAKVNTTRQKQTPNQIFIQKDNKFKALRKARIQVARRL